MTLAARVRVAIGTLMGLTLVGCLIGIVLTGPIVVRTVPLDWRVEGSAERLRASVETLCNRWGPRDQQHPENLGEVARWIAAELRGYGLPAELQPYDTPGGRLHNVVSRLEGSDPRVGAMILGAHYDAAAGSPGANDNASGVAVLLELARTLPQRRVRGDRYLVWFGSGEPPARGTEHMGSAHFVSRLVQREVRVELMVALDQVGRFSDEPGSQRSPVRGAGLLYPGRGDFIAIFGDLRAGPWIRHVKQSLMSTETLPVHSVRAPYSLVAIHDSDHASFRRAGLPGVLLTDTGALRELPDDVGTDLPDRLDYKRMAQLVEALHGLTWDPLVGWDVPPSARENPGLR